jgi:periplasmic divalent cation tolerance protein
MMEHSFVYITTKDRAQAQLIGEALVEAHLVACVNIIENMSCIYWWKGKVEHDSEVVLIAKTASSNVPALVEKVKALHSYEVPCVIALPIADGNPDYLRWITEQSRPGD